MGGISGGKNVPLRGPTSSMAFSFPFPLPEEDPAPAIVGVCVCVRELEIERLVVDGSEDTQPAWVFMDE